MDNPVLIAIGVFVVVALALGLSACLRHFVFHPSRLPNAKAATDGRAISCQAPTRRLRYLLATVVLLAVVFCSAGIAWNEHRREVELSERAHLRDDLRVEKDTALTDARLKASDSARDLLEAGLIPAVLHLGEQSLVEVPEVWRSMISMKAYLAEQTLIANPTLSNPGIMVLKWTEEADIDGTEVRFYSTLRLQRVSSTLSTHLILPWGSAPSLETPPKRTVTVRLNGIDIPESTSFCDLRVINTNSINTFCRAPASPSAGESLWWLALPLRWAGDREDTAQLEVEVSPPAPTNRPLAAVSLASFDTWRFDPGAITELEVTFRFSRELYGGERGLHVLRVDEESRHVDAPLSGALPGAGPFRCTGGSETEPYVCTATFPRPKAGPVVAFRQRVPQDVAESRRKAAQMKIEDRARYALDRLKEIPDGHVTYFVRCKKCVEQKGMVAMLKDALATNRASVRCMIEQGSLDAEENNEGIKALCNEFQGMGVECKELHDPNDILPRMFGYVFSRPVSKSGQAEDLPDDAYISWVVDNVGGIDMSLEGAPAMRVYKRNFEGVWNGPYALCPTSAVAYGDTKPGPRALR